MDYEHKSVLSDEVIEALNIRANGFYIDGTFGGGGHSRAILERLGMDGRLLAFDKDPAAIASCDAEFRRDSRFNIIQGSFTMLKQQVERYDMGAQVSGILLDLGVSSVQLDDPGRGFSYRLNATLDMRMNPNEGQSVADWLNTASETELADVIYTYGEERAARRIAHAIVRQRKERSVTNTVQLANLLGKIVPWGKRDIHPARKTFQALRIFINRELAELKQVLDQTIAALEPGGRLAVISFHSLEDRIVKRFIRDQARPNAVLSELPVMPDRATIHLQPVGKKQRPTKAEIARNPRARSALLRVAERCPS